MEIMRLEVSEGDSKTEIFAYTEGTSRFSSTLKSWMNGEYGLSPLFVDTFVAPATAPPSALAPVETVLCVRVCV